MELKVRKSIINTEQVEKINKNLGNMNIGERFRYIFNLYGCEKVLVTSSFATTSAMLLREVAINSPGQNIYFIDTNYHFNETIAYKNLIANNYDIDVIDVKPDSKEHDETAASQLWTDNPNLCCQINKVNPLEKLKSKFDVWISGLMSWQSEHRRTLSFLKKKKNILKCYPLLDVTYEDRISYFSEHNLIPHPLVKEGYSSIGCKHCTIPSDSRDGRWNNNPKTECGLHL